MSRSRSKWWILYLLTGSLTAGCAHNSAAATARQGGKSEAEDVSFLVQLAAVVIVGNHGQVMPPKIVLKSGRQVAIWGLIGEVEAGDSMEILFKEPIFKSRVQLHCEWRICAMHVPPDLVQPQIPEEYEYKIQITRKNKPPINIDPQVEVIP